MINKNLQELQMVYNQNLIQIWHLFKLKGSGEKWKKC
jgi:hypothetical protein